MILEKGSSPVAENHGATSSNFGDDFAPVADIALIVAGNLQEIIKIPLELKNSFQWTKKAFSSSNFSRKRLGSVREGSESFREPQRQLGTRRKPKKSGTRVDNQGINPKKRKVTYPPWAKNLFVVLTDITSEEPDLIVSTMTASS